jgi:hypothetical protein
VHIFRLFAAILSVGAILTPISTAQSAASQPRLTLISNENIFDGNPLEDVRVLEDYENNLKVIMKDGVIYKNTLEQGS